MMTERPRSKHLLRYASRTALAWLLGCLSLTSLASPVKNDCESRSGEGPEAEYPFSCTRDSRRSAERKHSALRGAFQVSLRLHDARDAQLSFALNPSVPHLTAFAKRNGLGVPLRC